MKRLLLSALLLVTLAGCAASPGDAPRPEEDGVGAAIEPVDLVGFWTLDDGGWLRIDPGSYAVVGDCVVHSGSWRASGGLLVLSGGPGNSCDGSAEQSPALGWPEQATGYRLVERGVVEVTDAAGVVVRTLTAIDTPPASEGVEEYLLEPPVVEGAEAMLAESGGLPAGLEASGEIAGRWIPVDAPGEAFVEFAADGTWTGSDGCNGNAGRWIADDAGTLLATTGPSTLIFCEGAPVPTWLASVTTAGLDGDRLVLLDGSGNELGVLVRA